ncbi:MAG: type I-C CRISPR-associated protein Cas8c/Csd1 [Phycisphaerales bacterium]|nr:type I-C CRISPR-associated protein Cas8c/Csd1 [Phycisphaerales bacterium]
MIIPALVSLYDRLAEDPDSGLAPLGYSRQQVSFKVVLRPDGTLVAFQPVSVRIPVVSRSKKKSADPTEVKYVERAAQVVLPGQSKPTGSGINPCFLWDNAAYMLGFKPDDPKPERTRECFEAFRSHHLSLESAIDDASFRAVCAFLRSWDPSHAARHPELADMTTNFGVFQIAGEQAYVHDHASVRAWWDAQQNAATDSADAHVAPDLARGVPSRIARLHEPKIKGVLGAQSSGATIVSFNQDSFESFGKSQGHNAPVSEADAFKYCTSLGFLTTSDAHRVRIAGDTYVFWVDAPRKDAGLLDTMLSFLFDDRAKASISDRELGDMMRRLRAGQPLADSLDPQTPFYVLGLSPNASRLSVRFWLTSTVSAISDRVRQHADALRIEPSNDQDPVPSISRLVAETAPPKGGFPDADRVIPTLAADLARAVLTGQPYPRALLAGIITRVRIEGLADQESRKDFRDAQHRRCAIIRAILVRNHHREVPVSLDLNRSDPPYLLGRLFAVLEETQRNALGKINRTIKDSFYGAASATPASVFPRLLLKLHPHHLAKIEVTGQRVNRDKELGSIMDQIHGFPRILSLEDQGLFAIGYYHQRQFYFAKPEAAAE